MITLHKYQLEGNLEIFYMGPPLTKGPLPALFYFAFSAKDSLTLSPFNEPIIALHPLVINSQMRIFSVTIPGHENLLPKEKAIEFWKESICNGIDLLSPFIKELSSLIDHLFENNILIKHRLVVSGLSRGGLITTLLAAQQPLCNKALAFAPLTDLGSSQEFQDLKDHPILESLCLNHHISSLIHAKIRFYIGNRDLKVKTENAFNFITSLANLAHEKRATSGSFELILTNSIGYKGHGTSEATFQEGAMWIKKELFSDV